MTAVQAADKDLDSPYYPIPATPANLGSSPVPADATATPGLTVPEVLPTQYINGPASSTIAPDSPAPPAWQPPVVRPSDSWKPGWLKSGRTTFSYVPASTGDDFGFVGLDQRLSLKTGLPFLTINPRFGILWTEGPISPAPTATSVGIDAPGQVFDTSVEARWFQPLNENWIFEFAVAPGLYTDGENTSSDALRITGRALAFYKWSESLRLAFGAVYLDRDDINVLPAAGLMIFPSYDAKIELMFPRPRVAYRFQKGDGFDRWAYIAGEFGGGQWAVERNLVPAGGGAPALANDVLAYRDYRVLFGVEEKVEGGTGWLVEGGFIFGREFEYDSGQGDGSVSPAAIVRMGLTY